ncbi:MAG: deoxyribodipyrimidine photo-lyase [Phycisphaerales bacterium]|nr:deoxyribodipyrimidine photo-lyase [Phycisphaerales bacterium]
MIGDRGLVWFRRDLRASDHTALLHAARSCGAGVVGVFVISPGEWRRHDEACCKVEFWLRCLADLSSTLAGLNIPLLIEHAATPGDVPAAVLRAAARAGAGTLLFHNEYEVNEVRRDAAVERAAVAAGLAVKRFDDRVIVPPGAVKTNDGGWYTVFSPFRRKWYTVLAESMPTVGPTPRKQAAIAGLGPDAVPDRVDGFGSNVDPALWPAGEREATRRLEAFAAERIASYKDDRDFPGIDGTSSLSPYLAAGVISARRCLKAAMEANGGRFDSGGKGPVAWISELVWREFYNHLLVAFPRLCMHRPFKLDTDRIRWRDDEGLFDAWKRGMTGFPIVDAAMRQLAATGWMHNRLRMVAAMFLTKDLFIDWRRGERYFMQCLVDGDLASNNGGWQWSASTGTDAAPYFRIFNPSSQSDRYDPEGRFIRRWVPELAGVDSALLHDPARLPRGLFGGSAYPQPIVDRSATRAMVVREFKRVGAVPADTAEEE